MPTSPPADLHTSHTDSFHPLLPHRATSQVTSFSSLSRSGYDTPTLRVDARLSNSRQDQSEEVVVAKQSALRASQLSTDT